MIYDLMAVPDRPISSSTSYTIDSKAMPEGISTTVERAVSGLTLRRKILYDSGALRRPPRRRN